MGTINAWWSEQAWNDLNCRLNIYHDTIHNNERRYQKRWWVNGALAFDNEYGTFGGVPLPNTLGWRYPYGTTFQFLVTVADFFITGAPYNERDRAGWGPGAFPAPPAPPQPGAPAIAVSYVARNTWDVIAHGSGATNHQVFVYDAVNGEPLYGSGGPDSGWRRYTMPSGQRYARVRGRSYNTGAAGATSALSDSFYDLGSTNLFPNAPGSVQFDRARVRIGGTARLGWVHADPEGDVQKYQHVQYRRLPSATWISLGGILSGNQYRDIAFGNQPGVYEARVQTTDFEDSYGAWSPAAQITVYATQIREGGTWKDAPDYDYVRNGGLWVPSRKIKLP